MLVRPALLTELLQNGGPFLGDNRACSRVTIQANPTWWLNPVYGPVGNYPANKFPIRWWQNEANDQNELEIPNLKTVIIDRQLGQDADTIQVNFYNTATPANGSPGDTPTTFGSPGWLAWNYGGNAIAKQMWNQTPNTYSNLLRENALLRVYQGYGGLNDPVTGDALTLEQALADGYLMLTGVFLVDTVAIEAQTGIGSLTGRSMAKLLIDQPLWPPLVPESFYEGGQAGELSAGINYYHDLPVTIGAVPGYGAPAETTPIVTQTAPLESFYKTVFDMAVMPDMQGYRILGSDGGVFDYGSAYFFGSEGSDKINAEAVAIENTATGNGYWMCCQDGGVFAFGDAPFLGNAVGEITTTAVGFRITASGNGYWICDANGRVYTFGDATYYGGVSGDPGNITAFAPRPQGDGYWMLDANGDVYHFGAAGAYGGLSSLSPNPLTGLDESANVAGIDSNGTGSGYRIATSIGGVYDFGGAQYFTPGQGNPITETLNAPISNIRRLPNDQGFYLVGEDGGVFTFGDAGFFGAMPGTFTEYISSYNDYSSIVIDILLWCGWFLYQTGVAPGADVPLFGLIELTGAYDAVGPLDSSTFDKVQAIDAIKTIRDTVGFIFRVREDGSAFFASPNIWSIGNILSDGTPTSYLPTFFDDTNIIDYIQSNTDQTLVSQIVVCAVDPYLFGGTPNGTVVTTLIPPNIQSLHGIQKPAMIGVPLNVPISQEDQDLMAEIQALQCWLGMRTGQLTAVVDPAVCPNDQIQIFVRSSGETAVHYVTGVHTEHDLDSGEWLATYATQWMGNSDNWAISSSLSSFFGNELVGSSGSLTDVTFDEDGNVEYSDTFTISDNLVTFLKGTTGASTQQWRIGNLVDPNIETNLL